MVLGQSQEILLETKYRYRQISYSKQHLTTNKVGAATANREFTQNETPLSTEIYRIRTWMVLGQSCNILVGIQYRYRQILPRRLDLTTTANREFTQNQTPLATEIHRIRTWMVLGQS